MAISARTASLQANRSGYSPYGSSGRIRLLSPSNNSVASIAKKTANSEMEVMVTKYNAGLISNEDMRAFLTKMQTNPGISEVDRTDLNIQIQDFDSRVQKDNLETIYKSAPDNSLAQVQAAQALSSYYKSRASAMQPGTPAHTSNIQNANAYDQKVLEINDRMKTEARRNQRYAEEAKVNQTPSNSAERATAKAEMWKKLYDQAVADGDATDANKYAAYYEAENTKAVELSDRETTSANKKQLTDFINTTINDYHDGKISGEEALTALQSADEFAYNLGDTAAQNRLNSLAITIDREIEKGITYSNVNGLSVKNKGGGSGNGEVYLNPDGSVSIGGGVSTGGSSGGSGSSGGTKAGSVTTKTGVGGSGDRAKTLTELDLEYKNNLIEANKALVNGEIPASSKDPNAKSYTQYVMLAAKERQIQLQNVVDGLSEIVALNPNSKQAKKLQTQIDTYSKELGNVTAEYNGIRSGNLVLAMDSSSYTSESGVSMNKPTLTFKQKGDVKDFIDVNGVYYKPREATAEYDLTQKREAEAFVKANKGYKLNQDENGYYVSDKDGNLVNRKFLDVTDTNGNVITYEQNATYGWLPDRSKGPLQAQLHDKLVKEADEARKAGQDYTPRLLNYNEINKFDFNSPVGTALPKPPEPPSAVDNTVKAATEIVGAVPQAVSKVVAPIMPKIDTNFKTADELGIKPTTSVTPQSMPQSIGSGTRVNIAPQPLKLAGTAPMPAIKTAVNPTGKTPIKTQAPPISLAQSEKNKQEAQKRDTSLLGSAKALISNFGKLFKF